MTCDSQITGSAHQGQGGVRGQGDLVIDLLARLRAAVDRTATIEGDPLDAREPDPEIVGTIRDLFDDPHPRFACLQLEFLEGLEANFDRIENRLDRALKISAVQRRKSFRVIDGGR